VLKKIFIPHAGNDHKPLFLRRKAVLAMLGGVLILEGLFLIEIFLILPQSGLFSSILPKVLVDLANIDRQSDSLGALKVNPLLEEAAQLKASDMAQNNYFEHTSPDGKTPWFWLEKVGYKYSAAGENLAVNFSDSNDIDKAWMNSLGHRANILNKNFIEIGIATASGVWNGKETIFVVQFFGRPAEPKKTAAAAAGQNFASLSAKTLSDKQNVSPAVSELNQAEQKNAVLTVPATDNFVQIGEVKNLADSAPGLPQNSSQPQSTFIQRLASMPRSLVDTAYIILAAIVLSALGLKIFVKIGIQYPILIFNGMVLLFCLISILYLNFLVFGNGAVY